jgi:hypothetical protein
MTVLSSPGSIRSPEHCVPGAAATSRQCLRAPLQPLGRAPTRALDSDSGGQSAVIRDFQISAIHETPFLADPAPPPNRHRPPTATAFTGIPWSGRSRVALMNDGNS